MHRLDKPIHGLEDMSQVAARLFQVKALTKAEISENIEEQIRHLVRHFNAFGPCLAFFFMLAQQL